MAQTITDLVALGGYWAVGSHGQQHGLGSPWDVWMLAKAAGPMTALEVASMMVLNGNPLENIRNTANIQCVMKAGSSPTPTRSIRSGPGRSNSATPTG